ncbi:MAG: hypothetical protein AAF957_25500 [Planctomycetota bacterium]
MTLRRKRVDVEWERAVYLDAVRRASADGLAGRPAVAAAHEAFVLAMIAMGRPTRATGAVDALLRARPRCAATWCLAARLARAAGDVEMAARRRAVALALQTAGAEPCPASAAV